MSEARRIATTLIEEGIAARAHFQIWWVLRNKALPRFYDTMNNLEYVDFFHASNAGHYKLFLLALSKIFDRDTRVAGLSEFRRALAGEGRNDLSDYIEHRLSPFLDRIRAVVGIRSQSLVHNERALSREQVYQINGITPNQLRELIDVTCSTISHVASELGIRNTIFDSDRSERATMKMLEVLERGHA
ncbi:hypothetical protein AMJ44_12895 [candidate division WOR-1 bacterium DG_54_3]|uniref:HEPN AbiU2-like domain-containing protein n=1 Tax=candidate division WOR-1 bacterium DG_54_3 TaxID=1703775 RepID=A0A0S7XPU4_UNCSA|nr:MAG: hypothetical protein AMJ44_12895 [candidate division WOR-1 bacterium DG_54_3]